MWVNHHSVFRQFDRVDRPLLLLNILLLMLIAFVPFPTRVVAEHAKSADDRQAAALLYGITMTITAILFFSVWIYGSRKLLRPDADRREVSGITRSYLPGAPTYATATSDRLRQLDREPDHLRRDRALLCGLELVLRPSRVSSSRLDGRAHRVRRRAVLVGRRAEQEHDAVPGGPPLRAAPRHFVGRLRRRSRRRPLACREPDGGTPRPAHEPPPACRRRCR